MAQDPAAELSASGRMLQRLTHSHRKRWQIHWPVRFSFKSRRNFVRRNVSDDADVSASALAGLSSSASEDHRSPGLPDDRRQRVAFSPAKPSALMPNSLSKTIRRLSVTP